MGHDQFRLRLIAKRRPHRTLIFRFPKNVPARVAVCNYRRRMRRPSTYSPSFGYARQILSVLALMCLALALSFTAAPKAHGAGSYWPEAFSYEACHGGSGSWQGAIYTQHDARFGRGSSYNAWCRFQTSRGGPGDGFGWGTRANVYEAHTFRSRWDRDAGGSYSYPFSGSYALNYVLSNFGDTEGVDFSNDSTALVLGGGPMSGSGDHYQCWGEGCHNSFAGLNIRNPHFFFHQRGFEARTYDRYLRNANHRVWMNDFQGPTVGARGGQVGAFNCLGGIWGHNGSAWWCGGRPQFLWSGHDNGESTGIGRGPTGLYLDGSVLAGNWGNLPNGDHYWESPSGFPGTGSHAYEVYRTDAGYQNWHQGQAHPTAWTGPQWVNIDQTNPTPPTGNNSTRVPGVWHSTPSITVSPYGATDQGSGVKHYNIYDDFEKTTLSATSRTITREGWHPMWSSSADWVDRTSGAAAGNDFYIDRTAPGKPGLPNVSHPSWTNAAQVDVSTATAPNPLPAGVNANAPVAYQHEFRGCGFNGACGPWSGWVAGSSGFTTEEGRLQYRTRAYDHAGNIGPQSDIRDALIDRTGPAAPVGSATTLPFTSGSRTITAGEAMDNIGGDDQSGINRYQYRTRHAVDPAASGTEGWSGWIAWANGASVDVDTEGHTEVQFRAVDNAGNVGAVGNTQTARIDRTGPVITDTATGNPAADWDRGVPTTVTSGEAYDNAGGSGVASYQYQFVGNGNFSNPELTIHSSADGAAELLPGRWFIRFRAIDNVGNIGPWGPINVFSWLEGVVVPTPSDEPDGATPGSSGGDSPSPSAPSALRRSWGADIADALCYLPSAETKGGLNCADGGLGWYKGRSND